MAMLDMLRDQYGVTLPLAEVVRRDALETVKAAVTSSRYVGREEVEDKLCDRIELANDDVTCALWIDANPKAPVLRKVELVYTSDPGEPRYEATVVTYAQPKDTLSDDYFTFKPKKTSQQIDIIPIAEGDAE